MRQFALFLLLFLSIGGSANAQGGPFEPVEQCSRAEIQKQCAATCAHGCKDRTFLKQNAGFCLAGNFDQGVPAGVVNAVDCPLNPKAVTASGAKTAPEDCSKIKKITERVACEERDRKPKCAARTPELLDKANVLITSIDKELNQYGDLLTLDFSKIDNRDKLCAYSSTNLDTYYDVATKNPDVLNSLQADASGIQRCQTEWDAYLSKPSQSGSDVLADSIIKANKSDLEKLKPTMERLTRSVVTLRNAAERIKEVARFHGSACRPEGTPVSNTRGK